jgi:hypothetical protein
MEPKLIPDERDGRPDREFLLVGDDGIWITTLSGLEVRIQEYSSGEVNVSIWNPEDTGHTATVQHRYIPEV